MSMSYFSSIKDDDDKDFRTYLQEAHETDLSEIERTGCVSEGKDFKNNHVIVMIPGLGLNKQERPETMFRKMLLLFLRKTHELVGTAYSIVYAHTNIDIINQYPLIYKFYSILPRSYKKNLQKMYVIHPNVGIRMFFEFARVFLSHKFYNKLCLLESILDFQRIIPPTQLYLPLKFLRKEDEEFEYKYCGNMASLLKSFDPQLGTIGVLDCCTIFLKENNGLTTSGLFRVPGDENELNLAKVRLQYAYSSMARENMTGGVHVSNTSGSSTTTASIGSTSSTSSSTSRRGVSMRIGRSNTTSISSSSSSASTHVGTTSAGGDENAYVPSSYSRIVLSENNRSVIIGDLNVLYSNMPAPASNINERTHDSWKNSNANIVDPSANGIPSPEIPLTVVTINNVHSIAQIFKMVIRDLPEPLISTDCYNDLVKVTRQFEFGKYNVHWEIAVGRRLSLLPIEHISTLIHVISFLREVAAHHDQNQMDAHNLAVVFAPTIFRPEMTDPIKAAMEVKLTQVILMEIIKRERVLALTLLHWKDNFDRTTNSSSSSQQKVQMVPNGVLIGNNPVLNRFYNEMLVKKGWTKFEVMFPTAEQDEANRQIAERKAAKAAAALEETPVEEDVPVTRVQTEEEIQEMMAIHLQSAMKGRMNIRGRESVPRPVAIQEADEDIEEGEVKNNQRRSSIEDEKEGPREGEECHDDLFGQQRPSSGLGDDEDEGSIASLTHRMTEFCRTSELNDDEFQDAVEGHDQRDSPVELTPALVPATTAPPVPPRRPGGRALPSVPPSANNSAPSTEAPRKPLPPTPGESNR